MTNNTEVATTGAAMVPAATNPVDGNSAVKAIESISKNFVDSIRAEMKSNDKLVAYFGDIKVKSGADLETAVQVLASIKTYYKAKESDRDNLIGPFKKAIKDADVEFKKFKDYIETTIVAINTEIGKFRAVEAARIARVNAEREAKAEAERKRIEAEAAKAAKKKGADKELIEYNAAQAIAKSEAKNAAKEQASGVGSTSFVKRWTGEIYDEKKVPREYLSVDTVKINAAIREGVRDIPGVKIYQKETPTTRS